MDTLGEWSDGDDDWIFDVFDENASWDWSDSEADDLIRNIDVDWSDSEADDIIRNIDVQTGRGEKRKSDQSPLPAEEEFYVKESVKKTKSKKFGMSATEVVMYHHPKYTKHAPTPAKPPKHAPKRQNPRAIHAAKSAKEHSTRKRRLTLG